MSISVSTNTSALTALQNLARTTEQMESTQNRVSTGLNVAQSKDNATVYAIAQKQRASLSGYGAVVDSLNRATSISDVAAAAGQSVSDLLNQIKQKVAAATEPSLDTVSRTLLNDDYRALLNQVASVIQNASFDGTNLLDGSVSGLKFMANADATSFVSLSAQNLSLGGSILTLTAGSSIGAPALAASVLSQLNASILNVNGALSSLGSQSNQIEAHTKFVGQLQDVLTSGIGALVDADMAKESARLQALQVQQQLGVQSLQIANASPEIILSLFKG